MITHRFFLTLAAVTVLSSSGTTLSAGKPNVLFIAVDDLNDWIGCMNGHPQALTPNIDRLAAHGVLFTNAHCAAPACNPSRAAVFSGQMPDVTGVWSNDSPKLSKLRPETEQLPMSFAKAGYRTLGTGKLSGDKEKTFDQYYGVGQRWSPLGADAVQYTPTELPTKGSDDPRHIVKDSRGRKIVLPLNRMPSDRRPDTIAGESFDWGPFDVLDSEMGDTQITDWAIERIRDLGLQSLDGDLTAAGSPRDEGEKPFFLGVGYYRPHIPLWAPKRFFDRFADSPGQLPQVKRDDLDDLSATAKKWAVEAVTAGSHATVVKYKQWQAAVEAYLACITYVDHEIGRLLDTLDSSPFGDNTVIVLWSDHGWHLGEKQHWGKWTGWERSTRVPLIMVPPKRLSDRFAAGGSRCDRPVGLIDLYPTLTEICAVESPGKLDGQSLVPLLREPQRSTNRAVVTMFDPGNVSLRTDHWRLIRYADGSEEIYDHREDPNEWDNLANMEKYAKQRESLNRILSKYIERIDSK